MRYIHSVLSEKKNKKKIKKKRNGCERKVVHDNCGFCKVTQRVKAFLCRRVLQEYIDMVLTLKVNHKRVSGFMKANYRESLNANNNTLYIFSSFIKANVYIRL